MEEFKDLLISIVFSSEGILVIESAIIASIASIFADSYKKSRANKEMLDKWIKGLRQSKGVDDCMEAFNNLINFKYQSEQTKEGLIFLLIIWFIALIILAVGLSCRSNVYSNDAIMFLMLVGNIALAFCNKKMRLTEEMDFDEIGKVYKGLVNKEHLTRIAAFSFNAYGFYYVYLLYYVYSQQENWMFIAWLFGLSFGILAYFMANANLNTILPKVKEVLDKKHIDQYPDVETDDPKIKGKLKTVFDENFLVLEVLDSGKREKICYPLEDINYLRIKE